MTLTNSDLAYMAGYFDGEGCITVASGLRLLVTATYPAGCEKLRAAFGGRLCKRKTDPKNKQQWQWTLFGEAAHGALRRLAPYMLEKQEQALLAMQWWANEAHDDPLLRPDLAAEIKRLKHISWTLTEGVTHESPE